MCIGKCFGTLRADRYKQTDCLTRGVGTGGATGARAPLVLQQAKLTYKAYVGQSLRDPVGSADHMAQGVRDAIGIATQYSYIIVRHYLEL